MFKKKSKGRIYSLLLLCVVLLCSLYLSFFYQKSDKDLKVIWGENVKANDLIMSVIRTPVMGRIKDVDQSGPAHFFGPRLPRFTRFEHCVGVWVLIKRAGAGMQEQVAGLLHDASYTVFSHVSDHLFAKKGGVNEYTQVSYQDKTHMQYLKDSKLQEALEQYNISESDLDPSKPEYTALEQPLPNMCADRIHYNIHTGVITGMISENEAKKIIENLNFKDNKWFFTDPAKARRFAELSVYYTQNFWGAKWNVAMNMHLAKALKRAIKIKLLKNSDLYLTDSVVMQKLTKNQDSFIHFMLEQTKRPLSKIPGKKYNSVKFIPKFRGIDPLIKLEDGSFKKLTEMDYMFKHHYDSVKAWCAEGYYVDVIDSEGEDEDL
ncbi:MAG: hypothetical protein LBI26_01600 [Holosporales bacterium]|nr:hypothetical protein [Holosporales bacterium]